MLLQRRRWCARVRSMATIGLLVGGRRTRPLSLNSQHILERMFQLHQLAWEDPERMTLTIEDELFGAEV